MSIDRSSWFSKDLQAQENFICKVSCVCWCWLRNYKKQFFMIACRILGRLMNTNADSPGNSGLFILFISFHSSFFTILYPIPFSSWFPITFSCFSWQTPIFMYFLHNMHCGIVLSKKPWPFSLCCPNSR